jgi:hypothetical protein
MPMLAGEGSVDIPSTGHWRRGLSIFLTICDPSTHQDLSKPTTFRPIKSDALVPFRNPLACTGSCFYKVFEIIESYGIVW